MCLLHGLLSPTTVSICLAVATLYLVYCWSRRKNLPPGPWGLPIVGYLPFLGSDQSEACLKLGEKYSSPVVGFYLGQKYTVILNSFAAIKDAGNKEPFLGKPAKMYTLSETATHLADISGKEWKEQRKLIIRTLRELGVGKNKLESQFSELVSELKEKVLKLSDSEKVDVHQLLTSTVSRLVFLLVCSANLEDNHPTLITQKRSHELAEEYFQSYFIAVYIPFLKPILRLFKPKLTTQLKELKEFEQYFWDEIENHEKNFNENCKQDFIDYYISEIRKPENENSSLNRASMNGNSALLLGTAISTVVNASEWIIMNLALYPDKQEKLYAELLKVLGPERQPGWQDRDILPYTMAFIMESNRKNTLAPMGDIRMTLEDTEVLGYDVPKGTIVYFNLKAVHNDPALWTDPETFRPERFLSDDGQLAKIPEHYVTFSYGKRNCGGEKFANIIMFLLVASLVQNFRILPPEGGLSLKAYTLVGNYLSNPYVKFQPR